MLYGADEAACSRVDTPRFSIYNGGRTSSSIIKSLESGILIYHDYVVEERHHQFAIYI